MQVAEVDVNAVAIGVANHVYDHAAEVFSAAVSKQISSIRVRFKADFATYVRSTLNRTNFVKTLIHPDEPVELYSIYVPLYFEKGLKIHDDSTIISNIKSGKRVLVSGTAGGGKSMLLKHAHVSLLKDYKDLLPIYFELRSLNDKKATTLFDEIRNSIQVHIPDMTSEILLSGMKRGSVAFILDGFDEISHETRESYARELEDIAKNYPKIPILVTSRPEEKLSGLQDFHVYNCLPMNKEQTLLLIDKIEYDPEKKNRFSEDVDNELYHQHSSFLSNPLLTNIMLLTYSYFSDIPDKIHLFYKQAFEALYQRHDRSKGVYTRRIYSNLALNDFQKVFEYFCTSTYVAQRFSFEEGYALEKIEDAIQAFGFNCTSEDLFKDLVE